MAYLLGLDKDREPVGQIEGYSQFIGHTVLNGVGEWSMTLDANQSQARAALLNSYYVSLRDDDGDEIYLGMLLEHDEIGGANTQFQGSYSGFDENIWLAKRLAVPDPSGLDFSSSEYDTRSDDVFTIIAEYVDYNAGANAVAARQCLTVTTPTAEGTSVSYDARFETLLELINAILDGNEIDGVFGVSNGVFTIAEPEDKTSTVIFRDDLDNLDQWNRVISGPEVNFLWMGGEGEADTRTFHNTQDSQSIAAYWRFEGWHDAGSKGATAADLDLIGRAEIEKVTSGVMIAATPRAFTTSNAVVGDQVAVFIEGTQYTQQIQRMTVQLLPGQDVRYIPTVGDVSLETNVLRGMEQRINRQLQALALRGRV